MGEKEIILMQQQKIVKTQKGVQQELIKKMVTDIGRLQAVHETGLVDTPEEASFDRLTKLASKLLKTPISFVTLLEKDRDFVKSHYGLPEPIASMREIRMHPSFCQHIISHKEPLILEDVRENPLFKDFPSVTKLGVVAYAGIPLITQDGQALGTCCVLDFKVRKWSTDEIEILTELAKSVMTEINLRTVAEKLKREMQYKDDFIGIASHELKTPLTSLKVYTQLLLKRAEGNDQMVEGLRKMDRQLNRLHFLISDLLDLTKIEVGRLDLKKGRFDLSELAQEVIEDMQKTTEKHTIEFDQQDKIMVFADRDKIYQVITNYISNAIKYSPLAGKVKVWINEDDNYVRFRVQDFGLGIEQAKLEKVFERFYRVSGGREDKFPGLGLGLYISSEIINKHKGTVGVESMLGAGSTFIFSLPKNLV